MSYQLKRIAVFASGAGTNAENLIRYFRNSKVAGVEVVFTNKPDAGVIQRARKLEVPCIIFNRNQFYESDEIINLLKEKKIDWIVLAGFLWKIPPALIAAFPGRIVNIHPALLPEFGGKGMYGSHVHEAVIRSGAGDSGISIHLVDENYDRGKIIFQAKIKVEKDDSPESLAQKIHGLEYKHFPVVVETLIAENS